MEEDNCTQSFPCICKEAVSGFEPMTNRSQRHNLIVAPKLSLSLWPTSHKGRTLPIARRLALGEMTEDLKNIPCLTLKHEHTLSMFSNIILLTSETWAFTFISFSISSAWSMIYFMCSFITGLQMCNCIIYLFLYEFFLFKHWIISEHHEWLGKK